MAQYSRHLTDNEGHGISMQGLEIENISSFHLSKSEVDQFLFDIEILL